MSYTVRCASCSNPKWSGDISKLEEGRCPRCGAKMALEGFEITRLVVGIGLVDNARVAGCWERSPMYHRFHVPKFCGSCRKSVALGHRCSGNKDGRKTKEDVQ